MYFLDRLLERCPDAFIEYGVEMDYFNFFIFLFRNRKISTSMCNLSTKSTTVLWEISALAPSDVEYKETYQKLRNLYEKVYHLVEFSWKIISQFFCSRIRYPEKYCQLNLDDFYNDTKQWNRLFHKLAHWNRFEEVYCEHEARSASSLPIRSNQLYFEAASSQKKSRWKLCGIL